MSRARAFRNEIKVYLVSDGTVTVATATMDGLVVAGSARRDPRDKYDMDIGADLAVSRALHAMARKFERQANGAVRNADWIRSERRRRRALEAAGVQSGPPDIKSELAAVKAASAAARRAKGKKKEGKK